MSFENDTTLITSTPIISTTTTTIQNECIANGYQMYGYDKFSCFMFQLPFNLYEIKFGYFSAALALLIILISLFGRIKLHYRWFILNMAIIDLITSYDFFCDKPRLFSPVLESPMHNCYLYTVLLFNNRYLVDLVPHLPPIGVFLLAISRFISVYFPAFFKKCAKTWAVIFFIFITNLIYIAIILIIYKHRYDTNTEIYEKLSFYKVVAENSSENDLKNEAQIKFLLVVLYSSIPVIILLVSILFFILLVFRIVRQLKFQAHTNVEIFKTNIRIITVLSTQTFMLCILLPLEGMYQFDQPVSPEYEEYYPYLNFPPWLYGFISENGVRCFREFRVFIDSLIILIFMKGYREDLFAAVLLIFKAFKKTKNGLKYGFKKPTVKPMNKIYANNSIFTVSAVQTF